MANPLVVFCTCATEADGLQIARTLVESRLAACVNVLPPVTSIYRWQGEVESANECLLLIKTTTERFPELEKRIVELHSYENPEILALRVESVAAPYAAWLNESV